MNETQTLKSAVVKTLAIVGFLVTIAFFVYITVEGSKRAPEGFASLASIAETINLYRPAKELTIATEKIVVNSAESFQISWTDFRTEGEYALTYECVPGVRLEVRSGDDTFMPIACTDTLTLPANVHGLSLTALSDDFRFTDIPLTVAFTNNKTGDTLKHTTKVTVVNATIPVREVAHRETATTTEVAIVDTEKKPADVKPVPEAVKEPTQKPVTPTVPQEPVAKPVIPVAPAKEMYTDLSVQILGSGVLQNGVFGFTKTFNTDAHNAIRFDVINLGTKTSGNWSFTTILPTGEVYTSPVQAPLAPQSHVMFTLGFYLDVEEGEVVTFTNTLSVAGDTKTGNNTASLSVVVE
ncbi:hypothetical protein IPH92_00150 [Candidatus Kaiserbacteria bacterium]|nr:MAG: hypothetical protein IPH92_00150 [Candidatus Kaiserbacteria bacterium]